MIDFKRGNLVHRKLQLNGNEAGTNNIRMMYKLHFKSMIQSSSNCQKNTNVNFYWHLLYVLFIAVLQDVNFIGKWCKLQV